MRDCCSHQEDTFGAVFAVLLKNYIPFWIIFSVCCFLFVIINFWYKQRRSVDAMSLSAGGDSKVKAD